MLYSYELSYQYEELVLGLVLITVSMWMQPQSPCCLAGFLTTFMLKTESTNIATNHKDEYVFDNLVNHNPATRIQPRETDVYCFHLEIVCNWQVTLVESDKHKLHTELYKSAVKWSITYLQLTTEQQYCLCFYAAASMHSMSDVRMTWN